jgi:eukaryotic-like serine/threonine-protein kinase
MPPADRNKSGDSRGARKRIVPRKRGERYSIPATPGRSSTPPPADLLDQATSRVGLVAGIVIVVSVLECLISHLWPWLTRRDYPTASEKWDLIGNLLVVLVSGLTLSATRWQRLATVARLRVGILYLLLIAYLVSLTDHADHYWQNGHRQHGIPWVSALVLVFPVIIPMRPVHALLLGLLMAATSPLAMCTHVLLLGYSRPDLPALLDGFPFLFALVAGYVAKIVQQLGSEVGHARQLGAYTLESRIGAGGMGEVWSASHRFLARPAAIKLLRPTTAGAGSRALPERFEREAQATAALKSPHTVQVYDFGASDDGRLYYAMELLEGTNLESLVRRHGPQPPERVVYWLCQICHSLAEAHENGLVHRDIKPANLFVCRYGREDDFIKVLDFGLVSLRRPASDPGPTLTATGHLIGTPSCMPPEMATNKHPVDGRSDLYSLGCVAYFLLTGEHVFRAPSAIEIVAGHVTQRPPAPSEKAAQAIPEELDQVVLACLEKSPEHRPQNADELLEMLNRCPLPQRWTQARARSWWDRVSEVSSLASA